MRQLCAWCRARLGERSTWTSAAALCSAIGAALDQHGTARYAAIAATAGTALVGLLKADGKLALAADLQVVLEALHAQRLAAHASRSAET